MRRFAALYAVLDETTRTSEKVAALAAYLREAPPEDAIWAIHFLIGRRPKRLVSSAKVRAWAAEKAGVPDWLFEECYTTVGDLAEAIALLLPPPAEPADLPLHRWIEDRLLPMRTLPEAAQRRAMEEAWDRLGEGERFVWNKLITGNFRVGVSQGLTTRALALATGLDEAVLAHRLMGPWEPAPEFHARLVSPDTSDAEGARPYPFYLAYPLESDPETLGDPSEWLAEWKWDGIRAQLIRRGGEIAIWSRGEEMVTHRYPELEEAAALLPDGTVLDGEIVGWKDSRPLPFGELQRRIGRDTIGRTLLREVPVAMLCYDLLEAEGEDLRDRPLHARRERLEGLLGEVPGECFRPSPVVRAASWSDLAAIKDAARAEAAEGLMLKRLDSPYRIGRKRGDWWKWKVDPYTADAVLVYAQRGRGRRAGLYTDYTFALWKDDELVPFAKAYSGLTDEEIREVDRWVRSHTVERYGPVRSVEPELVFELAFEGIRRSPRHRAGIAVRFPRIARWRRDKPAAEADSLETVRALLPEHEVEKGEGDSGQAQGTLF